MAVTVCVYNSDTVTDKSRSYALWGLLLGLGLFFITDRLALSLAGAGSKPISPGWRKVMLLLFLVTSASLGYFVGKRSRTYGEQRCADISAVDFAQLGGVLRIPTTSTLYQDIYQEGLREKERIRDKRPNL